MPYLLLAIGVVIGLYALYRFFIAANPQQIKALFLTALLIVVALAVFALAITGRLPAALALIGAMVPIVIGLWRHRQEHKTGQPGSGPASTPRDKPMDKDEALKILGLSEGASAQEIEKAYKKLMKKVHPDQEGSEWMAIKLNEAHDYLLEGKDYGDD